MSTVKTAARLTLLAALLAGVAYAVKRVMGFSSEWQSIGESRSPASAPTSPTQPVTPLAPPPGLQSVPESAEEVEIERGVAEGMPVVDRFAATPDPTTDELPAGYDPLTDPIPPNEL